MMKIKTNHSITSREAFAKKLSYFINWRGFCPYKPNKSDDSFWRIDGGNNWKVKFHCDKNSGCDNIFELVYRYDSRIAKSEINLLGSEEIFEAPSEILSKWVAWLYGYEIIPD